jgi:prophage regulatory protein
MHKKKPKKEKKTRKKSIQPPLEIHPDRLYRLNQIIPHFIPVSRSSWYQGIKEGKYPSPRHLGPRTAVWEGSKLLPIISGDGA